MDARGGIGLGSKASHTQANGHYKPTAAPTVRQGRTHIELHPLLLFRHFIPPPPHLYVFILWWSSFVCGEIEWVHTDIKHALAPRLSLVSPPFLDSADRQTG